MDPLFDQISDELASQNDKRQLVVRQRADDVVHQMSTVQGRRFVWTILRSTRVEGGMSLFDTHGGRQSYNLGAFEEGRKLADEVRRVCPEQYMSMIRENNPRNDEVSP